ncbi:MAG: N-acetylmuramoyl-L-alanine amidase, partial [Candidatus Aquilonibacter sp.]
VATTATPPPPPGDMTNATVAPSANPSPQATGNATVSAVSVQAGSDGSQTVAIAVTGDATYEWHRLRAPDNRFWIDIKNAQLADGPQDQAEANPLVALRVRQIDPQTVRIALSLAGDNALDVSPAATGLTVNVGAAMLADTAPRSGSGSIGAVVSASEPQTLVTPVPADEYGASSDDQSTWKFGPQGYVPTNPKLIVLDPGHGGTDRGSMHGDLQEAILTLDMAKRVQAILVARGWQVKMTRTIDHDVDPTPRSTQEAIGIGHDNVDAYALQARDDIANEAGARLFVSIHCNAYLNSGPNGATVYYSKPIDQPLALIMDRDIAMSGLGVKDDGIVKSHLYVTLHANMPAILIETAFLSNPTDYAKLASSDWRQQMAQAIADGIDKYAQANPVTGSAQ